MIDFTKNTDCDQGWLMVDVEGRFRPPPPWDFLVEMIGGGRGAQKVTGDWKCLSGGDG